MSCLATKYDVMSKVHCAVRGHSMNGQAIRVLLEGARRITQEEGRIGAQGRRTKQRTGTSGSLLQPTYCQYLLDEARLDSTAASAEKGR